MSKAVTNEEVEDVLSSIRRLVSEDKRPLAGVRSAQPAEPAAEMPKPYDDAGAGVRDTATSDHDEALHREEAAPDRFVLTPALRVAETPEDTDAPLDLGAVARKTWTDEPETASEETLETDKDAPLMLFPDAPLPQAEERPAGADPAMDAVDALVHDALEADAEDDADYSEESFWEDEPIADSPADYDIEAQELLRDDEEDNGTATDRFDGRMPDGDDLLHDYMEIEAPDTDAEQEMLEAEPDAQAADLVTNAPEGETTNISVLPLTAKIAALEAAVGGIKQDWEPDGNEEEDLTVTDPTAIAWEDDVDLDARGAPVEDENDTLDAFEELEDIEELEQPDQAAGSEEATSLGATIGMDDQLLDEDALRELVSEIVRTELQGALGERITRNVRKLVRREIHRALTAQELE